MAADIERRYATQMEPFMTMIPRYGSQPLTRAAVFSAIEEGRKITDVELLTFARDMIDRRIKATRKEG